MNHLSFKEQIQEHIIESTFQTAVVCEAARLLTYMDPWESLNNVSFFIFVGGPLQRPSSKLSPTLNPQVISKLSDQGWTWHGLLH